MQSTTFVPAFLSLLALATTVQAQDNQANQAKVDWLRDVDQAQMLAGESKRDVFVLFTGRGWCQPCEMLNQSLFNDPDFVSRLQELCVPVELDFNFGDTSTEKMRGARFRNWAKRYLVLAYPTMVFMDSRGQPYFVSAYPESGPADFFARIEHASGRKKKRDEHFALAERAEGAERARELHAGISAVAELLTTIEDRKNDPVLTYYADEVLTIMATPSSGGELTEIHDYYRRRLANRDNWMRENRFWEQIAEWRSSSNFEKGIESLHRMLEHESSGDRKLRLNYTLTDFLVSAERYDDAISQIDSMLATANVDDRTSRRLWDRKVKVLYYNADRRRDAYDAIEQWVATCKPDSQAMLDALERKGMLLWGEKPKSAEAIKAWETFRNATERDTFDYLSGTAYLARCENAAGNFSRAAKLWDEILSVLERQRDGELDIRWPWSWDSAPGVMIQAAEVNAAAKDFGSAQALLDRAETAIELKAQSDRESTGRDVEALRERLKNARQAIVASSKKDGEPNDEPKSR